MSYRCEAEVTEGLEFIAERELEVLHARILYKRRGEVGFLYSGDLHDLLKLRTIQAVSLVAHYDIPRPRALLSNVHLPRLLAQIEAIRQLHPRGDFYTLFVAAAGSDSSVMERIKAEITKHTGLKTEGEKGDLWLRIRPGANGGWETVTRISPRPLVTRSWRVCNLEGALNAATAHAMIMLTQPQPTDHFLNLGCGSGTLLIERLAHGHCKTALGIDHDLANLRCAQLNIDASGYADEVDVQIADMTRLPYTRASINALVADLPFGQLTGTHKGNTKLYPLALDEAGRVAKPGARFVLITHEVRLMEKLLHEHALWQVDQEIRVNLRGLHPRIYVLVRR